MTSDLARGMVITNGSSALYLHEHVDHHPRWKAAGWKGINVGLEEFGGDVGMIGFVPDYLLSSWRPMPREWSPVTGGGLEERYVARDAAGMRYRREVRRAGQDRV